ncbi:MAG: hypothetical protein M3O55_02980 [Actinomycetota bacterium]|nr:hypothetical protein [Actinomycetota bacterium]
MVIVVVCGVLLIAGIAAGLVWGGLPVTPPWTGQRSGRLPAVEVVRRYVWWLNVGTVTGLVSGLLVAGAGGRLVMRLLAVTSPDAAGRITEADEVVGRISVGGTVGFIIFGGLAAGMLSAILFLLIRRWLPSGRLGGLAFGALLLVLLGSRLDPLRADNVDFSLVGPAWLAVLTFGALGLIHGMAVAGLAGRLSRSLPLLSRRPKTILPYLPLLALVVFPPAAVVVIVLGVVVVAVSRLPRPPAAWSARVPIAGRILTAVAALVALPGFVRSIVDVLSAA